MALTVDYCNEETEMIKTNEQSCNKITLLILHFYFTSLKSGENVIFLNGFIRSVVSQSSRLKRAVAESVEFQEK